MRTTIDLGTLRTETGCAAFGFMRESCEVTVAVFDPRDTRKSTHSLILDQNRCDELKEIVRNIDAVREEEAKRRLEAENRGMGRLGEVAISLESGGCVSIPDALYLEAKAFILDGKTMMAASHISRQLKWISPSGASELARSICEQLQQTGMRK